MKSELLQKKEWINNKLDIHIKSFSAKRKENKKKALKSHVSITILGAITTVLLGLEIEGFEELARILALLLSAGITIFSAYSTFFNNKKLWINFTNTRNELYKIRDDFEYYLTGLNENDIKIQVLDEFKIRIQNTLHEINNTWMSLRKD